MLHNPVHRILPPGTGVARRIVVRWQNVSVLCQSSHPEPCHVPHVEWSGEENVHWGCTVYRCHYGLVSRLPPSCNGDQLPGCDVGYLPVGSLSPLLMVALLQSMQGVLRGIGPRGNHLWSVVAGPWHLLR